MKVDLASGGLAPARAAATARVAEAMGFDALWLPETDHDPFVALPLALTATSRLEVGTAVAIAFARSPLVLAMTAWDLAALGDGRFALGLGTQVRAHVERRFGMAWSEPAPRLAEWLGAIRAAWATWQDGVPFRWRSDHLDLSLMTPFFSPPPLDFPAPPGRARIPVSIAGVGPGLARLAGRLADGFQVHPFHTQRYLAEILEPALQAGEAARDPALAASRPERIVPVFLAPVEEPDLVARVRAQIAFYGATPSYRGVLRLHGREAVGERLGRLAATGRWQEMPALVDDELLGEVAVMGPWAELPDRLAERVAGRADRVVPGLPLELAPDGSAVHAGRWETLIRTLRSA